MAIIHAYEKYGPCLYICTYCGLTVYSVGGEPKKVGRCRGRTLSKKKKKFIKECLTGFEEEK